MEAWLVDPLGPFWRRALPGSSIPPRFVDVVLSAGAITFRDSHVYRRVRARDLVGASTARTRAGVAISLVTRGRRKRPLTLEVARDADAAAIVDALGIGRGGFGEIAMPTDRYAVSRLELTLRCVTGVAALVALFVLIDPHHARVSAIAAALFLVVAAWATAVLMVAALVRYGGSPGFLLSRSHAVIRMAGRWIACAYTRVGDVSADARGLTLTLHDGRALTIAARASSRRRDLPSREELEIVAAQVVAAAQRAHGEGDPAPTVSPHVRALAKTEDRAHAWFARLDATAASFTAQGAYRGAPVDEADLWSAVEDPDAPADLRAAAARVLVRAGNGDTRTKLEDILPRVRSDDVARRIRIALDDDTERAAEAWAAMDPSEVGRSW